MGRFRDTERYPATSALQKRFKCTEAREKLQKLVSPEKRLKNKHYYLTVQAGRLAVLS